MIRKRMAVTLAGTATRFVYKTCDHGKTSVECIPISDAKRATLELME